MCYCNRHFFPCYVTFLYTMHHPPPNYRAPLSVIRLKFWVSRGSRFFGNNSCPRLHFSFSPEYFIDIYIRLTQSIVSSPQVLFFSPRDAIQTLFKRPQRPARQGTKTKEGTTRRRGGGGGYSVVLLSSEGGGGRWKGSSRNC